MKSQGAPYVQVVSSPRNCMTRSKSGYIPMRARPSCPHCGYAMQNAYIRHNVAFGKARRDEKVGWCCRRCKYLESSMSGDRGGGAEA